MGYNKLTIVFGLLVAVASVNGAKYVPKWKKQVKLQVVLILLLVIRCYLKNKYIPTSVLNSPLEKHIHSSPLFKC